MELVGIACLLAAGLGILKIWISWFLSIEEKNRRAQEALDSMDFFYEQMRKHIDQARKYRHDMPKHMYIVEEAINRRKAENDGDSSCGDGSECGKNNTCGDSDGICMGTELLDTILFLKGKTCAENEIPFHICIQNTEMLSGAVCPIEKVEFSGLIQNLLDNAIEENLRIEKNECRRIDFSFGLTEEGTQIEVRNACADKLRPDFFTKKKDHKKHGYGVKIIREIAESCGGRVSYRKENGEMTASVVLPHKPSLQMRAMNRKKQKTRAAERETEEEG